MLLATCADCQLEASLDPAAVVQGDLRCQACDGALVLVVAEDDPLLGSGAAARATLDLDPPGEAEDLDEEGYRGLDDDGYDDLIEQVYARLAEEGYTEIFEDDEGELDDGYRGLEDDAFEPGDPTRRHDPAEDDPFEAVEDFDDPFAQAAAQLDSSVSATIQRARRQAALVLGEELPPPAAEDDDFPGLDDTVEAARTEILEGEAPTAEPLPSFDGGDTYWIDSLASERLRHSMAPPLSLDETQGLGAPLALGEVDLPLGRPEPEEDELEDEAPEADPLEGTQRTPLFGDEAVDWLALLDDNLTESEEDDPEAQRVYIHLPESASPAPVDRAQFNEAVRQLEAGGAEAFANAYAKTGHIDMAAATQAISDAKAEALLSQVDTRNWGEGEGPPTVGDSTVPLSVYDTRKFTAAGEVDAARPLSQLDTSKVKVERRPAAEPRGEPPRPGPEQATLEWDRRDADPALVTLLDGNSASADYFRQLYQRVFHSERGEGPRVVLVTSPGPGDGKTTVATNLALVAARSPHRRAFLVDADPRGGGVLRYMGVRKRVDGLLEALDADADPAERLLPVDVPGDLRVLPLGIPGSHAIDLLASDRRVGDLLSRLRSVDPQAMIVVDGSYALDVADPLVWARLVDGVIVVARAGRTSKSDVRQALELIGYEKVLGVVLNDCDLRKR